MDRSSLGLAIHDLARLEGHFTLRSGQTATTCFDKYQFESQPRVLHSVAEALAERIPDDTELLAGLELGGIPVVTALSLVTGIPAVFVRKEPKAYGMAKLAEGPDINGATLLVVEDVVTSGGQVVQSTDDLRRRGADVHTAVCVIDRQQGGTEALAAIGVQLSALFIRDELEH